ncbi:uncharacterized protein [Haliotis asinina]|uniref:uncharacterized protein n=1 Tax=Haliotis asinina TaxID=109174 RepID=UPI003531846A
MEKETDNKLPFLDVLVQRENHTTTSVYRKPTHTDQYIHFPSCHPIQVKRGVIATLIRRAKNIEIELYHLRHASQPKTNTRPPLSTRPPRAPSIQPPRAPDSKQLPSSSASPILDQPNTTSEDS